MILRNMWKYIITWTLVFIVQKQSGRTYYYCHNKVETLNREDAFIEYETVKSQPANYENYITKVKIDSVYIP